MKRIVVMVFCFMAFCSVCCAEWIDFDSCVYVGTFGKSSPTSGKRDVEIVDSVTYLKGADGTELGTANTAYVGEYSYYANIKHYYINPITMSKNGDIVVVDIIEVWDDDSLDYANELRYEKAVERESSVFHEIKPITVYTVLYDMRMKRNAVLRKAQYDYGFVNERVRFDNIGDDDVPLTSIHLETPSKAAVFYKLKELVRRRQ